MPMNYEYVAIPDSTIPRASLPMFQHMLNTYASETNKVISVWRCFALPDMSFRPHPRSSSVLEIMKHQLLSERRFFGEFLSAPDPPPSDFTTRREPAGLLDANAGIGISAHDIPRGSDRGVVAGGGSVFRCRSPTDLDILAAAAPHLSSPYPARCVPATAE